MRVIYAKDARALRMIGALGPMQSEAVTGVLTIVLKPIDDGTRILWEYVVSGHLRKKGMAGAVDAVLTERILRHAESLGDGLVSGWTTEELDGVGIDPQAEVEPSGERVEGQVLDKVGDAAREDALPDDPGSDPDLESDLDLDPDLAPDCVDRLDSALPDGDQSPDPFIGR